MKRLELEYAITNVSVFYEEATVSWDKAEFTSSKGFTGHLKLWEDDIEPEDVWEELKKLEERAESCRVALRYRGNCNIIFIRKDYPTYHFDDRSFPLRSEKEFAIFTEYMRGERESFGTVHIVMPPIMLQMTEHLSPTRLPQNMPTIPSDLHRMAETLVAADELSKYPDLVMKLAFIILEDLKGLSNLDVDEVNMKHVRDFVSHPICGNQQLIAFIDAELPSARVTEGVQFRRNDREHIAFVAKYAYPALQRAKALVEEKVRSEGGFLRD